MYKNNRLIIYSASKLFINSRTSTYALKTIVHHTFLLMLNKDVKSVFKKKVVQFCGVYIHCGFIDIILRCQILLKVKVFPFYKTLLIIHPLHTF